ncbi:MAG: DUF4442 domain-containing protein [Flavobacteriales bacterium]|nr:DUF4442 domain-containing protein [Flavobacteriales bacterium]
MNFDNYIQQAKASSFGLKKLNFGLSRMIPFNRPHGIKLLEIGDDEVKTIIPYKRKNLNHIKGIHACGLATAAEFASGFLLITKLGNQDYRLIMESIDVKFHYQAKKDVVATFEANDSWTDEHIRNPLKTEEKVYVRCEIVLHDIEGNHVATAYTNWQIKEWSKVKTKV